MNLRITTLAVIGSILMLMIVLISWLARHLILQGYAELEQQSVLQNAKQAVRMLDDELAQVKTVIGDWAPWDDTYQFVEDVSQEYIDNNLADSTIINLPVDFLLYYNLRQELVQCKFIDPETKEDQGCPESLLQFAAAQPFIFRSETEQETITGLAMLPEAPVLLSAGPILTSKFEGPVRGTLIAGRYLSAREVARLATKVDLSLRIEPLESANLPRDFSAARQLLSEGQKTVVMEIDDNTIVAYALLSDLQQKPILMMGVDRERLVYAQGRRSLLYIILAISITGLVFIVATLVFLENRVLSRLIRLNREVQEIGSTGDLQRQTTVAGNDELARLSLAINEMVESVRVSTERDRAILESMEDGYFELDLDGKVKFFNEALARIFGFAGKDLVGVDYRRLLNRASARITFNAMRQLFDSGRPITGMETGFTLTDGREIFLESTISLIRDGQGRGIGFRGIARDVTARKKAAEELIYLAYHDTLTGLLNRKAFYEHLKSEITYAARYSQQRSLLFIDLDKFKLVNDQFGHKTGDELLRQVAVRIGTVLRNSDIFCRLGGDEFVIILAEPHSQSPQVVAQRILATLAEPFYLEDKRVDFVSASIGISVYPLDGEDPDLLLLKADKLMYRAKQQGGAGMQQAQAEAGGPLG